MLSHEDIPPERMSHADPMQDSTSDKNDRACVYKHCMMPIHEQKRTLTPKCLMLAINEDDVLLPTQKAIEGYVQFHSPQKSNHRQLWSSRRGAPRPEQLPGGKPEDHYLRSPCCRHITISPA